ncbi:MAG: ABC transporter ATP-binding protein [Oscillospiraceae bacterium]
MNEKSVLLSVRNLTINYCSDSGVVRAVNGISFDLKEGETLGLVGETGAGKTTTALGLMGLIPDPPGKITGGEILFCGKDLLQAGKREMRLHRGKDFSMIFQDPMTALNPVLTVGDQISEVVRLHKMCSKADAYQKVADMLALVGISPERMTDYPHQFSGGMQQRVVIAIALACNPRVMIADEPTTALDVTIQAQVLALMRQLRQKFNTAMLMITHDLGVVAETCDRVAIVYAGQIVESGTLRDIYEGAAHPYTHGLFESLPSLHSKTHRLRPIPGLAPDPTALPLGCSFHPRCRDALPACRITAPENAEISPGHFVRCLLYRNMRSD